mmetsp:Transcript_11943/g.28503  ORF Transcript_11943/g.28503 Transcript_11943/m.28503 type:complete len:213 (+) Transcript_11943:2980-3618(+)
MRCIQILSHCCCEGCQHVVPLWWELQLLHAGLSPFQLRLAPCDLSFQLFLQSSNVPVDVVELELVQLFTNQIDARYNDVGEHLTVLEPLLQLLGSHFRVLHHGSSNRLQTLLFVDLVPVLLVVPFLPQGQSRLVRQTVVYAVQDQVRAPTHLLVDDIEIFCHLIVLDLRIGEVLHDDSAGALPHGSSEMRETAVVRMVLSDDQDNSIVWLDE